MPYSYPGRIPKVAKNWDANRQRKCVRAAQAVLNAGGAEEDAVFACIHAAKTKQVNEDEYDTITEDESKTLQNLLAAYFIGKITLKQLEDRFKIELREFYVRLALLGGRSITEYDLRFLDAQLKQSYEYLLGFMEDLEAGRLSEARALWRAGKYAYPRAVFINFTVAASVASLMPFLPGDDCLGNGLCRCHLEVVEDGAGGAEVYWILDPAAESCEVCISHAIESPFRFSAEELADAF